MSTDTTSFDEESSSNGRAVQKCRRKIYHVDEVKSSKFFHLCCSCCGDNNLGLKKSFVATRVRETAYTHV